MDFLDFISWLLCTRNKMEVTPDHDNCVHWATPSWRVLSVDLGEVNIGICTLSAQAVCVPPSTATACMTFSHAVNQQSNPLTSTEVPPCPIPSMEAWEAGDVVFPLPQHTLPRCFKRKDVKGTPADSVKLGLLRIHQWTRFELHEKRADTADLAVEGLTKAWYNTLLPAVDEAGGADVVVLEQQVLHSKFQGNVRAKILSHVLQSLCVSSLPTATVGFASAKATIPVCIAALEQLGTAEALLGKAVAKSLGRKEKKKLAVEAARGVLHSQWSKWLKVIDKEKKKDDMADSFLQGIAWLYSPMGEQMRTTL